MYLHLQNGIGVGFLAPRRFSTPNLLSLKLNGYNQFGLLAQGTQDGTPVPPMYNDTS
jgi:hypothetical protein